jgi:hypothetical protein
MRSLLEEIIGVLACTSAEVAANEDIFNGNPASDVIRLSENDEILFIIHKSAGAVGTATITVESCDDVTPTTHTAIPFKYRAMTTNGTWGAVTAAAATGFTTTAGANQMYIVSVKANQLVEGHQFVRLVATEVVDAACDGAILAVLVRGAHEEDIPPRSFLS